MLFPPEADPLSADVYHRGEIPFFLPDYDPKGIALSIPALLTVWAGIQRFSEELVLVGGLVPHFICRHPESSTQLPRPATVDVDIGIALVASSGQYGRSSQAALPIPSFAARSISAKKCCRFKKLTARRLSGSTRLKSQNSQPW